MLAPTENGPFRMALATSSVKTRWRAFGDALRRLVIARAGAMAIEFAILAIPYCVILFAIIETFVAHAADIVVADAVQTLSRKVRTGEITYNLGRATDITEAQFRQMVCDEVSVLLTCSESEAASPHKLFIDVKEYASFAAMPRVIPRVSASPTSDLDTSGFSFTPGGPGTVNMVRVYYRWTVMTDLMRPYLSNLRPADGSLPKDYLVMSTATFQNEDYK